MRKLSNEVDSPAMIQHCLNCTRPKCNDCLGQKSAYSYALRAELSEKDAKTEKTYTYLGLSQKNV